ncbi:NucA/NucB deoxyribonuclease domain-containing protein [Nonomuraea aridisoli]|uniref:Deoxyribonuclease NucA/NucB domain-containing protein n=1 Tax=Nonomuraea aridisoli TaxID=2070368 RepID=A0A2W2ER72_9ACTN|nr:hypothetical protein C1J01_41560 [Nonomuraea aridisoli]
MGRILRRRHRRSRTRNERNRNRSRTYCADILRAEGVPRPINRDCDEYPFAATHEGSAGPTTNGNVAVGFILWDHNEKVGTDLGWFVQNYRVLGSEPLSAAGQLHPFEKLYVDTPN